MAKKNQTFIYIFIEALKLYFSNFDKFLKYMTFPVLGQFGGLILIFVLASYFSKNIPIVIQKVPSLNDPLLLFALLIMIALPGLVLFMRAFWEYLVAYGALNSMLENMLRSGKVYDFDAHTELVKRRTLPFVGLWALVGVFSLVSIIPFFWVPCAVLAVFFVLIFQVFTFEEEQSPMGCVKRSLKLVKGHFFSTFCLIALVGALTYVLIPHLANIIFEHTNLTRFFANLALPIIQELPISDWNVALSYMYIQPLKSEVIATFVVTNIISQILIQYTLPLRSILWGIWYKNLNNGKFGNEFKERQSKTKRKTKKPSEKLMESSNKKYSSKKLDKNILRRAMEKDSDNL